VENERQDLKEMMEVASHILSGLDIEKIMQGVACMYLQNITLRK